MSTTEQTLARLARDAFEAARDGCFACSPMEEQLEALRNDPDASPETDMDAGSIIGTAEEIERIAEQLQDAVADGDRLIMALEQQERAA